MSVRCLVTLIWSKLPQSDGELHLRVGLKMKKSRFYHTATVITIKNVPVDLLIFEKYSTHHFLIPYHSFIVFMKIL